MGRQKEVGMFNIKKKPKEDMSVVRDIKRCHRKNKQKLHGHTLHKLELLRFYLNVRINSYFLDLHNSGDCRLSVSGKPPLEYGLIDFFFLCSAEVELNS